MSERPRLLANLGAEEGDQSAASDRGAAARNLAILWRALFDPPAYPWLEDVRAAAWWNDADSVRAAGSQPLLGAAPEVVRRVHDKGWAVSLACEEHLDPPVLRGLPTVLEPKALRADDASERVAELLGAWPEWARGRFTLKPRIGTSARGRVAGTDGRVDAAVLGALERLAGCGGAVLEPWLDRLSDASAQLLVAEDGAVTLLGTLEIVATQAGVTKGHRGELDSRGRARTGLPEEEALREAAGLAAAAAASAGYRGPCGVDAFAFRSPEDGARLFRPLVEFNARFTAGTVALGHVRGNLPRIKSTLGLAPGELFHFYLGLDAPPAGWPGSEKDGALFLPLVPESEPAGDGPGLFVARERGPVDSLFSGAA